MAAAWDGVGGPMISVGSAAGFSFISRGGCCRTESGGVSERMCNATRAARLDRCI